MSNSGCTDKALELLLSHPGMKVVGLSNSDVTGESLKVILVSNNSVLKELNLSRCCYLTDEGVIAILNQVGKKLEILNLSRTEVSFSEVGFLTSCLPVLEELNLEYCKNLTNAGLKALLNKAGKTLKILNLGGTRVSFSEIGPLINTLPVLQVLDLSGCPQLLDDVVISILNQAGKTLKILNLGYSGVSFSNMESQTCTLPSMEELHMDYSNLTDAGLMAFLNKAGKTMKILNLEGTDVTFSLVGSLNSTLPALENLDLRMCGNYTHAGLMAFLDKAGETLKVLNFRGTIVSLSEIGSLTSTLPVFEELNLEDCEFTDAGLMAFLNKAGKSLKILNLKGTEVSFSNIGSLTCIIPALENLNLKGCLSFTDAGLMELLNKVGSSVKILNLKGTKVSFPLVGSLTSTLPALKFLDLANCDSLADAGLMAFLEKTSGHLKIRLNADYNVDAIRAAFPHIKLRAYWSK